MAIANAVDPALGPSIASHPSEHAQHTKKHAG
jgi:hypothetical protein